MNENAVPSILRVLTGHRVLGRFAPASLAALASRAVRTTPVAGMTPSLPWPLIDSLLLVESGSVELVDLDACPGLNVPLGSGDCLGAGVTAAHSLADLHLRAVTDATLICLPVDALAQACREQPALGFFFPTLATHGAASADPHSDSSASLNLLTTPLRELVQRDPVTAPATSTIHQVAQLMRAQRVSSVMLIEQEHLFGLVTDRDLRNRALAQGLDTQRPIADIATLAPLTASASSPAFEALTLMARHNIHHVPVMEGNRVVGVVTASNLTEQHSASPVYLAGDIYRQSSIAGLARVCARVPLMQRQLAAAHASAYGAGRIITTITDALTTRLIHLAEAQLGPAPIDYAWVAAGSQARSEQTAKSDQDNCMVLDDAYDEAAHGAYFRAFSRFVCDGLDACGYVYCPGEMMAMTDRWRQPRQRWLQYFRRWIEQPEPTALMLTSVFFDLRAIHGQTQLLADLRRQVLDGAKGNTLFLSHLAGNALKHRPPLGLFGGIGVARTGEHAGTVDLKHSGIVPIVDLARVHALSAGVEAVNTHDRLEQAGAAVISVQGARDLRDALEFIGKVRIAHQARQTAQGLAADNFLRLNELSNLERSHLKDAFGVVQQMQAVLTQRYGNRY